MSLRDTLFKLTRSPHMSGSQENFELAQTVAKEYVQSGLHTFQTNYNGYIKLPEEVHIELTSPHKYTCKLKEECVPTDPTSCHPNITSPHIAYTADGHAKAPLVYVNYGRVEDFEKLKAVGVNITGKIAIARYGYIFRGNKAYNAEKNGAIGLIIYSDPGDDAKGPVYPEGPWRSPTSIQGGSAHYLSLCPGDPMRLKSCNVSKLTDLIPSIPVHPLSYGDAEPLMRSLNKNPAPSSWQGGFSFPYYIDSNHTIVDFSMKTKQLDISLVNVHGFLKGTSTDKFVIVGSHRDAWSFGAVDPGSATSIIIEVANALGNLAKRGWKPRRSIYFMSWDGEEQGQLGSSYWVESNEELIRSGALAYFNLDTAVSGPFFSSSATPSLASMIRNITKFVNDPTLHEPIYNIWDRNVKILGSGSDFTSFLDYMGIPSSDVRYTSKFYGVYHSSYDSFHWMDNFGDPGFKRHKAISQVLGLMTMTFADARIIPYNFTEYGYRLLEMYNFTVNNLESKDGSNLVNLSRLQFVIQEFLNTSMTVHNFVTNRPNLDDTQCEAVNNIFMMLERQFLGPGLPGRRYYKHIVQAPGMNTGYGAHFFPGINDSIDNKNWASARQETRIAEERIISAQLLLKSVLNV